MTYSKLEFNYREDYEIEKTSCDDMLNTTTGNVIEMITEVHEIMNDVESVAHEVDLGDETNITPYLRVVSFFVRIVIITRITSSIISNQEKTCSRSS